VVTKSPAGFEVEIIYSLEQPPQWKQPVNGIFSAFKGIIIVDSHWFRCPRIIVVFVSSSALLSYFTFTAMTSRRYLSQIHYSIEGHYSLLPPLFFF
jgi:hypothetical protein